MGRDENDASGVSASRDRDVGAARTDLIGGVSDCVVPGRAGGGHRLHHPVAPSARAMWIGKSVVP